MKHHAWNDTYSFEMSDLIGRVFKTAIGGIGADTLTLSCDEGDFVFHHDQNCCESVRIQDITGDLTDLLGSPITLAEETTSSEAPEGLERNTAYIESETWTFYKLATIKGYVDIRWLGESNGYYSESVDLKFIPRREE
jgi:hypothetical protein